MPNQSGLSVVVTRPAHQAGELCELIRASGHNPIEFPVTQIKSPPTGDCEFLDGLLRARTTEIFIFVSPNAVRYGLSAIKKSGVKTLENSLVLAIGPGTAKALVEAGVENVRFPQEGYNSEALLTLDELQKITGRNVLIVRGNAGRERLAQELAGREGCVYHLPCYQRQVISKFDEQILNNWRINGYDFLVVTSITTINHLFEILGLELKELTAEMKIVFASNRILDHWMSVGLKGSFVSARNPSLSELVAAIG